MGSHADCTQGLWVKVMAGFAVVAPYHTSLCLVFGRLNMYIFQVLRQDSENWFCRGDWATREGCVKSVSVKNIHVAFGSCHQTK